VSAIEELHKDVERIANERVLEVIDALISKRPYCRRIVSLREYVSAKIDAHYAKKRARYADERSLRLDLSVLDPHNTRKLSYFEASMVAKSKRMDYYSSNCDCGDCEIKNRPSVFADNLRGMLHNGL